MRDLPIILRIDIELVFTFSKIDNCEIKMIITKLKHTKKKMLM